MVIYIGAPLEGVSDSTTVWNLTHI